jgi:tetratricopeptide (TPR) repeat protein
MFIAFCLFALPAFAGDAEDCRNANLKATRVEACTRLIAAHPARDKGLAALYDLRSQAHADAGDHIAQAEDLGAALRLRPTDTNALVARGAALIRGGDTDAALTDLNAAIVMQPNNAAARLWRGRAYRILDQFANAEADLKIATALDPKNANVWVVRGWLYVDTERFADAIKDFDQAVALAPNNVIPIYNRAYARAKAGSYKDALMDLSACSKIDPDDPDCHELKGQTLTSMRDYKGAAEAFAYAIARSPKTANLYVQRADVLRQLDDFEGATQAYSTALDIDSDMATLYERGWVHALSGRPDNAISDYSIVLRREGADAFPAALIERGLARVVRGDLDEAAKDFQSARAVAPDDVRAALWRAALGIRLNRESLWASWRRSDTLAALKADRAKLKADRFEAPFVQALLGERTLVEAHRVAHVAAATAGDPAEAACFADTMAGALAMADGDFAAAARYFGKAAARGAPKNYACLIASAELNRLRAR